jgi:hypothetical protein
MCLRTLRICSSDYFDSHSMAFKRIRVGTGYRDVMRADKRRT